MKHKMFLFALLLVAIIGSNRAMANEDVYPFVWKNEYKYFVDPTFHTVKFCNDYKNVLCVSDSTIEILDAENGKSLRKKKYDFKNDMVEVSAKNNLIVVGMRGGFKLNFIDFTTLELLKPIETNGWVFGFKFFQNNLLLSTTKGNNDNELTTYELKNFETIKSFSTTYELHEIVVSEKTGLIYFLNRYSVGSNEFKAMFCSYNLTTNEIIEFQDFNSYFKNLRLSPQENYLGFINSDNSQIKVFDIRGTQKPKEIKEIDFKCFEYCFSYDETEIFYDYTYNAKNPLAYLYNLESKNVVNKFLTNFGKGIEINLDGQLLALSFNEDRSNTLSKRAKDFYSSISEINKKNLIEIKNNIIIFNFYENRNIINLTISDISGREINKFILSPDNNKPVDLNYLQKGVYFISLSSNNNILETLKFIKE